MHQRTALVSIVMPCYNAAAHLRTSVGSVLAQSQPDWELIAIDDGSRDDSCAVLESFADPRIRILKQTNSGVSRARNRALEQTRGRFVAFLDADDTWEPDFLAHMLAALEARPEAILAYCGWQNLGLPGGRGTPFVPPDYETVDKIDALLGGCRWPIHAALVRGEALRASGGFPEHYTHAEDYRLWLELATQAPIVRVGQVLAYYHFHGGTQASNARARAALQTLQVKQDFIAAHPERVAGVAAPRLKQLTLGVLRERALEAFWQRDLDTAQVLWRALSGAGWLRAADLRYLVPAWLPRALYRWLCSLADAGARHGLHSGN